MANPNDSIVPASSAFIQNAGGLAGINQAGLTEDDLTAYKAKVQDEIDKMQHAYDQPNWFKFAAGMLKPQLGGFFASLGSGAEALGQNVEQQRAMQVPISQQKIEIARADILLDQRKKQNQIYQYWLASGKPMDSSTWQKIAQYGDSPVKEAASTYWDQAQKQVNVATSAENAAQKSNLLDSSMRKFAALAIDPNANPNDIKANSDQLDKTLANMKPPQVDQTFWDGMTRSEKAQAASTYAKSLTDVGLSDEDKWKKESEDAVKHLNLLSTIRDLALGKGLKDITVKDENGNTVVKNGQQQMADVMGIFSGNNMFDIVGRALDEGRGPDLLAKIDGLIAQGRLTPEARDKFQELVKQLSVNQVQLSQGITRPTDAYRSLIEKSSPTLQNSQAAMVGILDLMAHDEKRAVDNYRELGQKNTSVRNLQRDDDYLEKQKKLNKEHSTIAISQPSYDTPYYYNPAAPFMNQVQQAPQSNASAAAQPSGGQDRTRPAEISTPQGTIRRSANGTWSTQQP